MPVFTQAGSSAAVGHIPIVSPIVDTVGYAFPLAVLFLVYLLIKYPDRLAFTHGPRPGVDCVPGLPILGNTITLIRRGVSALA